MLFVPAALAQNTQSTGTSKQPVNSGAGVPGLPGNKSGPAVMPNGQILTENGVVSPDQSGVQGTAGEQVGSGSATTQTLRRRKRPT